MPCFNPLYARETTYGAGDWQRMRYYQYWVTPRCSALGADLEYEPVRPQRSFQFLKEYGPEDFERDLKAGDPPLRFPCRKCLGCRLDHSREWANRILMELCYHRDAWFLTLTYSDDNVPRTFSCDQETGEIISPAMTLVKKDFQDFMKRLRFNSKQDIRYYAAGEYGDKSARPHYHIILFGLHLDDIVPISKSFSGEQYYISSFISKCWSFGHHILGQVTFESAAYVARYTMKKANKNFEPNYYELVNIESEFQVMSNRPGIASNFFFDHLDIFDYDSFYVETPSGSTKIFPPEYFRKLYKKYIVDGEEYLYYKSLDGIKRRDLRDKIKLSLTDNSYRVMLSIEEEKLESRLSSLIRDL